jgi:hypothetical protein
MVFEVGDQFATMTKAGRVQVFVVSESGHPTAVGPVVRGTTVDPLALDPEIGFGGTRKEAGPT